jgi:hypothetical protein
VTLPNAPCRNQYFGGPNQWRTIGVGIDIGQGQTARGNRRKPRTALAMNRWTLHPFGRMRVPRAAGIVLALLLWGWTALADSIGIPIELPVRAIASVPRDWRPYACAMSNETKIVCAIKIYLACTTLYRTDLCELVGLYPRLVPQDAYDIYGEGDTSPYNPEPSHEQFRLLEFRNLDARYSPPVLLVHVESRTCYRLGPPPQCSGWYSQYLIISHLDTGAPSIAASGGLVE